MERATKSLPTENVAHISTEPVVTCNACGDITYANRTARLLSQELAYGSLVNLLPKDHSALVNACLRDDDVHGLRVVGDSTLAWHYLPLPVPNHVMLRGTTDLMVKAATLLQNALDHLTMGVVATNARLRLLAFNQSADRILSAAWPQWRAGDRLFRAHPQLASRLIKRICEGGGPVTLSTDSAWAQIEGMIVLATAEPSKIAYLYIADPQRIPEHTASAMAALYGLTRGEVRAAEALLTTCNVGDAATKLGLSRHTLRTHLRSLWRKTGTSRTTELVRCLSTSVATRVVPAPHAEGTPSRRKASLPQSVAIDSRSPTKSL